MDNGQTTYDNRTLIITSVAIRLGNQTTASAAIGPEWSELDQ